MGHDRAFRPGEVGNGGFYEHQEACARRRDFRAIKARRFPKRCSCGVRRDLARGRNRRRKSGGPDDKTRAIGGRLSANAKEWTELCELRALPGAQWLQACGWHDQRRGLVQVLREKELNKQTGLESRNA